MKVLSLFVIALFVSLLATSLALTPAVRSQSGATEAPALYDNQTNGFTTQAQFDADRVAFETREERATGLGPVYNAQACVECHQNRVTGGNSQIMELRAGHTLPDGTFVNPPGGSLIQSRSVGWRIQERVPDGPRIAFMNDQSHLSVMGFDGGQFGAVGNTPIVGSDPSFSPDGTQIVLAHFANIWVVNSDGTDLHQLTTAGSDFTPAWSPDGTKIAFISQRTGIWQIYTMNTDGTNQTNITNSSTNDGLPAYSPDGAKISFSRGGAPNSLGKLWTMNADGTGQVQITTGPGTDEWPSYSPDGTMIAFSTNRDGNYEIYKIPAVGGTATRLTVNTDADRNPSWAPDNSAIAYESTPNTAGALTTIQAVPPGGGTPSRISPGVGKSPAYSRDQGETIRTFRASPAILGLGFVEATDDSTFMAIRAGQPESMRGTALPVPVLEAPGLTRLGRFGWKNSVASLLTFSAGAYL
jgi:hypothetical protein